MIKKGRKMAHEKKKKIKKIFQNEKKTKRKKKLKN
jgi:hypothetical protein